MAEKKANLKTVLIIIAGIIGYGLILFVLNPIKNNKEEKANKVVYIPSDIKKKYPEDFRADINILQRIKANIVSDYTQTYNGKYIHSYVDSKGRVIYKTTESINADKSFIGKSGGYSYRRFYPDEEGYLYDKEDKIINKLEIKNFYEGFYYINTLSDMERKSYISTGFTGGTLKKLKYTYDEKGNMIKEERVKPSSWYEKEITEYSNGKKKTEKKIIDYEVDAEEYNKIYVEITKEYDENEKMIKKFVLRKNKFNAIRSETNFDFIKGEIVTKYYDGEKAFATVTETLIGKDRAIVKRERVGDEFVIWDLDVLKKQSESIFWKRYITNKEGLIMYELNCERQMTYDYNYLPIGIYKESFINDSLYYERDKDYGIGGTILNKIYQYNYDKDKIIINEIENQNKISDDFYLMNIKNITNKIKKNQNSENKIIDKIEINNIMEEYKNGN